MSWEALQLKTYDKKQLKLSEQVKLLASRGLIIADRDAAEEFLRQVNYYRFSAYCIPFEVSRHKFISSARFEDVVALYNFDESLRAIIRDALSLYENAARTTLAYQLSHKYESPFIHEEERICFYKCRNKWSDLIQKLHKAAEDAAPEKFIEHYRITYLDFPKLPIWIAVEVMTFGTLSKFVACLTERDQSLLAKEFGLPCNLFVSSLHATTYIRNLCAHHSRLWNRELAIALKLPNDRLWNMVNCKKIASVIYLLSWAFKSGVFPKSKVTVWKAKLEGLFGGALPVPGLLQCMGFMPNWREHVLWKYE